MAVQVRSDGILFGIPWMLNISIIISKIKISLVDLEILTFVQKYQICSYFRRPPNNPPFQQLAVFFRT